MASTTRTITSMGMSPAAARAYVLRAVAPIADSKAVRSWTFQKNHGTRWPEDPGGSAG